MKKKYIIIFPVLILALILVYFFVSKIGENVNFKNNSVEVPIVISNASSSAVSEGQSSSTPESLIQATSSQESEIENNSTAPVDAEAVNKRIIEYIPKISSEQIDIFSGIAVKGDMSACEDLSPAEADNCKYYFSVYKNQDGLCGDIDTGSMKTDCYKKLVFDNLSDKIEKCDKEQVLDFKSSCFNGVFWGNETVDSCSMFSDESARQICVDSVNLRIILEKNKNNCSEIKDASLKTFCDQHFIPGDFDKDGLFDAEESKIGTNPYIADTDGDSYNDKDEIDKGYNPCGEGLMPTSARLLEVCDVLTK